MDSFPLGKLPAPLLEKLLAENVIRDPRVLVGPRIGEDAAIIDFGATCLVAKTDPITFATDRIGWYAVHINANDVATMGAAPRWFLATVLLPEGQATAALVRSIFDDLRRGCEELNVTLCGGHTEITAGLDRPIVVGQMLGEVLRDRQIVNTDARPGHDVILTKGIAIEGTAIMARERPAQVREEFGEAFLLRAQRFLDNPGISVVAAALAATEAGPPSAIHDPTEGGLATGLMELAHGAGAGLEVDLDKVFIWPETQALCDAFGLDPMGTIASGALLVVSPPDRTAAILRALAGQRIHAAVIGKMTPATDGMTLRRDGKRTPLPTFEADEITKLF